MKIAIASEGKTPESRIFDFAGRAPFYLVFEDKELVEVIENPFLNQGGVGFKIPAFLEEKNIGLFVAGNFGGNMERNLKEKI
ncbi:MAG: NifB/NifX family molybdenum-iron cluster-binding protein [Minisyncoccales bacterium]